MSHSVDAESVINNVLRMTQSVLEAAAEVKSVKRVILTSSATAVPLAKPGVEGVIIDESKSQMFSFSTGLLDRTLD